MKLIFNDLKMDSMVDEWNKLTEAGKEPFYLDHYELSELTSFDANDWKNFLRHPDVAQWLNEELEVLQQAKLRLLTKDLDSNSRSTGLPQLMNTLYNRIDQQKNTKSGPAFIYCFVPLNAHEEGAENVEILKNNPFERKG